MKDMDSIRGDLSHSKQELDAKNDVLKRKYHMV